MNILFVLIPMGLGLLAVAVWAFFWAVGSGQFDDLETPGTLVLFDEEPRLVASSRAVCEKAAAAAATGTPR